MTENCMTEKAGVIYILTNPSFPDYVKIGYAKDIEQRLSQLNRSECIPYAFRVYAIYETTEPLQDKRLHALIDQLNPELRSVEEFDGIKRIKEFYAISAEEAYNILEAIAEISGTKDRLKRMKPEGHEIADEKHAEEVRDKSLERGSAFSFIKCNIPIGAEIQLAEHPEIKAKVVDDRKIEYNGEIGSLSGFAQKLLDSKYPLQGPRYWAYQGKTLYDIRSELEEQGLYRAEETP